MTPEAQDSTDRPKQWRGRVIGAITLALAIALSVDVLINASSANNAAFASFWFLAILPAYLCALICYVQIRMAGGPGRSIMACRRCLWASSARDRRCSCVKA